MSSDPVYVPTDNDVGRALKLSVRGADPSCGPPVDYHFTTVVAPGYRAKNTAEGSSCHVFSSFPAKKASSLRIGCWNTLSQEHYEGTGDRRHAIAAIMDNMRGDVLCAQEVDADAYSDFYAPVFESLGFSAAFSKKNNTGHGLATFVRQESALVDSIREIRIREEICDHGQDEILQAVKRYHPPALDTLRRCNTTSLFTTLNVRHGEAMRKLIVINTHLWHAPSAPHIRAISAALLLRRASLMQASPSTGIVLCGDMNSFPGSATIDFISNGIVPCYHPDWAAGKRFVAGSSISGDGYVSCHEPHVGPNLPLPTRPTHSTHTHTSDPLYPYPHVGPTLLLSTRRTHSTPIHTSDPLYPYPHACDLNISTQINGSELKTLQLNPVLINAAASVRWHISQ